MPDPELADAAEKTTLFAALSRPQSSGSIRSSPGKGHVVGFHGSDGITMLRLRAASIGNLGRHVRHATDVRVVRLICSKGPHGCWKGEVIEGRKSLRLTFLSTSRMGRVPTPATCSACWEPAPSPFIPMAPIQVLTNNLLYDSRKYRSHRRGGRRAGGAAAASGTSMRSSGLSFFIAHQLDFRLTRLSSSCSGSPLLGPSPRVGVSDRAVRRVADDADSDHPRHSHQ